MTLKIVRDCDIHPTAKIMDFVNLYECEIGKDVFVGPFVEIQRGVKIGKGSKISSHSFLCEGVMIGENCFIAHGVMFTNDLFDPDRSGVAVWTPHQTWVGNHVRIGSNATILPVHIGDYAIVGGGSVVTDNVPPRAVVAGVPARVLRILDMKTSELQSPEMDQLPDE